MQRLFSVFVAITGLGLGSAARGQVVTVPERLAVTCVAPTTTGASLMVGYQFPEKITPAQLTSSYLSGTWETFHALALGVIKDVLTTAKCPAGAIDLSKDRVNLIWVGKVPGGTANQVYTATIGAESAVDYDSAFPGLGLGKRTAFELFVSQNQADAIASAYTSTRVASPLESQLPDFVSKVLDPLNALLDATQIRLRTLNRPMAPEEPVLYATMSAIPLPFARATIAVTLRVSLALAKADIVKQAGALNATEQFGEAAHSQCAMKLADSLAANLTTHADECAKGSDACIAAVRQAFDTSYATYVASCPKPEAVEVNAVDKKFRTLVAGLDAATIAGSETIKNTPPSLLSFGALASYAILGHTLHGAVRVKVNSSGGLQADPLSRQLTLAVVNCGFTHYDADAPEPSAAERLKWFVGAVLTPDFGVAAGVSFTIVRGLAVNAGQALLGVKGLRRDDRIGSAPVSGDKPLRLAAATATFLGVSYNFK